MILAFSTGNSAFAKTLQYAPIDQAFFKSHWPDAQVALNYAMDYVFADILDHDSSVLITAIDENDTYYIFTVTAESCSVDVFVHKLNRKPWNPNNMVCK